MEQVGPSKFRPYYNPAPASYLTGRTEIVEGPGSSDLAYDFIDSEGLPRREALIAILKAQVIEYIGICIAQPFENAKILLQCQLIPKGLASQTSEVEEEEEEEEDPDYFSDQPSHSSAERRTTDRNGYIHQNEADDTTRPPWQIAPKVPPTLGSVMDAVWASEGVAGTFKATNLSFCYSFLKEILEGQLSGLLSVFVGIPDPSFVLDSNDSVSLTVNLLAVGITALILAPLDIARTKIILTPLSEPRGILYTLKSLPSRFCPVSLVAPTLLERCVPLILSRYLGSLLEPISSLVQLFITLPLETILHRAQISFAAPKKSVVHIGAYTGLFGTPIWLTRQEGDGAFGLYRGWKAGAIGVLGVWSLGLITASQERRTGTEF